MKFSLWARPLDSRVEGHRNESEFYTASICRQIVVVVFYFGKELLT